MCGHHFQEIRHQPGLVANPALHSRLKVRLSHLASARSFSTPGPNLVLTCRTPSPLSATVSVSIAMRHRASPEFNRSRNCVTDGVHYRQSYTSRFRGSSTNESLLFFRQNPMEQLMFVLLSPHQLLMVQWTCASRNAPLRDWHNIHFV